MNKPVVYGTAAMIVATAGLWLWRSNDENIASSSSTPTQLQAQQQTALSTSTPVVDTTLETSVPMSLLNSDGDDDSSEDPAKMFKADAAGNLFLAERTRINVEKVLWLYSPEEQQQKLAVIEQTLPASAYRQLVDLMERYQTLTTAAKQAYPPNVAPSTVEEAIAQHEGLSALRKSHLGPAAADAMFGKEEKINRQLLEFMNLEKHEGLTMDEKAQKAQEMLSKSPELSAAYEANRQSARPNN